MQEKGQKCLVRTETKPDKENKEKGRYAAVENGKEAKGPNVEERI